MKKEKKDKKKKLISLKFQIAFTFLGLLAGVIAVCIVMNTCFLENYYIKNKRAALKSAYNMVNSAFSEGSYKSDDMQIEIQRVCGVYNISMIVMDETTDTVLASENNPDMMSKQLLDNIFGPQYRLIPDDGKDTDSSTGDSTQPETQDTQPEDPPAKPDSSDPAPGKAEGEIDKVLEENDSYTIKIQSDFRTGDQYLEMWGMLDSGELFLMRTAIDSITDSVSISNRFLLYIGLVVAVISFLLSMWASRRISKPLLELTQISSKMKDLDFDAKYTGHTVNEIGVLGENINELSEALEKTISELKTANNQLEKDLAHRTEIDDMRKEFLSNVTHELKTPLAIVQGYAEGLKDCVNDDEDSRNFYCDVIIDEASKMNGMVKKLLTLNQLEFGNDSITIERFDIVALIKNYLQSADILIRQNEANVSIDEYPPIEVWGDEFKIEEVFTNYFSNALNHLDGERKIDVKINHLDENHVRVSVFNTGKPIPEDSIEHIWDKFYKVDKARTREYGGSGVGLSIVKAIQNSLNQDFGVKNYNNGVEFYFDLDSSVNGLNVSSKQGGLPLDVSDALPGDQVDKNN